MVVTSTSIHKLNADKGLRIHGKIVWKLLNLINNKYFPNKSDRLCILNFCPELNDGDWQKIHIKSSPSRSLSDLFWLKLDWGAIKSELGFINIFDTGAGSGGYALKLNAFAGGISTYFGIDFRRHMEWVNMMREYKFIKLKQHNSDEIQNVIPHKTNFFMSQSAIEHFDNDLLYFQQIRDFIEKTNRNVIQVHLFPSAACFKHYPCHGVRQYVPRTISRIVQLFNSPDIYSILFKLGGKYCNNLHDKFITYPLLTKNVDFRDLKSEEYRDFLKLAVEKDIQLKNYKPNFYALVIHSNFNEPIFKVMKSLTKRCT